MSLLRRKVHQRSLVRKRGCCKALPSYFRISIAYLESALKNPSPSTGLVHAHKSKKATRDDFWSDFWLKADVDDPALGCRILT